MSATIQNIARNSQVNMPGSSIVYFVPSHLVSSIPKPDEPGKITNTITLSDSQKWYYWHCTYNTIDASNSKSRSSAGSAYTHLIEGFIPRDHHEFVGMMELMRDMRFVALRKDGNGYYKLLGSVESPLEFSYEFGAPAKGQKGYSFSMSAECRKPEYFYEGLLQTADGFVDTTLDTTVVDLSGVTLMHANSSPVTS